MKKAIVVGCIGGSKAALAICKEMGTDDILFYEKAEDVPIQQRGLITQEVFEFTMPKRLDMPFIPKAKHLPKGHQRPYKYHG
jgi:hypothetical protein